MATRIVFHRQEWAKMISEIIETDGVRRMRRVADACNAAAQTTDYKVSTEGSKPLRKRKFRATVITAGAEAMRDNARNNRLVYNFYRAASNG